MRESAVTAQEDSMKMKTLSELFRKHGVNIAYLFGSQKEIGVAFLSNMEKEIAEVSDLDIGVVFGQMPNKIFDIYCELYADISIIFEPFAVDLVFLQETDALFQYEAIKGHLIYCEDESFLDDYEEIVMKRASDLSSKKPEFEKDFMEALKNGYFEIEYR
jgi:hypothetical protein